MAAATAQKDRTSFGTMVSEWAEQYNRGFAECAQATLEPLGGGRSQDPRIAFLAACTQLRRLRHAEARESLAHSLSLLQNAPQLKHLLPNTVFARLPEAIDVLLATLDEGLMPDLRVSPAEFLHNPQRSQLQLTGGTGGGLGRYMPPRSVYQARSLVEARESADSPPRVSEIPSLREPISIRDDSITIRDDSIVIRDVSITIRTDDQAAPEASVEAARTAQQTRRVREDMARALADKARTLESIQGWLRSGDTASAMRMAQQAVGRYPQSASVRESLARVQEAAGLKDRAARTYLATAQIAATATTREGRLERCLRKSLELAGENLTILREALAAAQRAGLTPVVREALIRLLMLRPSISDPIQRQSWARQLSKIEPDNPLVRDAFVSAGRFETVSAAAGVARSVGEATPGLQILEEREELGGLSPLPGMASPAPTPSRPAAGPPPVPAAPPPPARLGSEPFGGSPPPPPPSAVSGGGMGAPLPRAAVPSPPRPSAPRAPSAPDLALPGSPARPAPGVGAPRPPASTPGGWPTEPGRARPAVAPAPEMPGRRPAVRPVSSAPAPVSPPSAPTTPSRLPEPSWASQAALPESRSRPASVPAEMEATFPCFYCGKPVPQTEVQCPSCGHQQPAFLQKRAREQTAAAAGPDRLAGKSAPRIPESPLTRGTMSEHSEEMLKVLLFVSAFATFLGWVAGSSVFSMGGFLLATSLEKQQKAKGGQAQSGVKFLKVAAMAGFVIGLIRGSIL